MLAWLGPRPAVDYSLRQTIFRAFAYAISGRSPILPSLDFDYKIHSDTPDRLLGDPAQLRTIIHVLVRDLIRCEPAQPVGKPNRLVLSCRLMEKDDEGILLQFCARKTGYGFGSEQLSLMMEYCQAEEEYPWDSDLAMALGPNLETLCHMRREVLNLHGNIWVHSVPHQDTRFFFTMRSRVSAHEIESCSTPSLPAPYSNKTVLFLDSSRIQTGVANLIAQWGLKTIMLHDTDSLVDHDGISKPDTIVASSMEEVQVPFYAILMTVESQSLFQVTKLRTFEHLQQIPIVLLAPALLEPDTKWCIRNHIISHKYLTTSISPSDLCMALTEGLSTRIPRIPSYYILAVEDNVVNQRIMKKFLEKFSHEIDIAENGREAVEMYTKRIEEGTKRYDLVMMDETMPIMSGLEAIRLIRTYEKEDQLTPVPIIGLTHFSSIAAGTDLLEAGANDVLNSMFKLYPFFMQYISVFDDVFPMPSSLLGPLRIKHLADAIDGLLSERNGGAKCQRYESFY
ncbi:hypothetical protein D9758_006153 [Tetrapyrgos nigripes]|uniref:Response regulatory domain-containing protein n=1 Tax=Tetrapyrgos nigripes TaxID=182062 RepID=A0A8H5GB60_9AGAR|nr:hypothetical protein D9758_006153 [Tetrapyrgos nigripes]